MKTWEIDVEMRVRKTLIFSCPGTEEAARAVVQAMIAPGADLSALQKRERVGDSYWRPVERLLDKRPEIVAVREVAE